MKKIRVLVLMGGKTPEYEVSLVSGREVVRNLNEKKYEVLPVVISKDGQKWELKTKNSFLLDSPVEISRTDRYLLNKEKKTTLSQESLQANSISQKADVVFIAMHGPYGEDGTVQGMLDLLGIPYTGSGVLASALGMDKPMFRKVINAEGLPTPKWVVLNKGENLNKIWQKLRLPVVVKPSAQGSSVGVTIVRKMEDLSDALNKAFNFGPQIIIDEYLPGTEVTCGVLGNEKPVALPVVEIIPKKEFFDYEAKYQPGMSEEIAPARISRKLTKKVQDLAIKVYKAIGCRGFGRVDMIIFKGKPYVLEINTIPGLTPNSLLPKAAKAAGISFSDMLDKIIGFALERNEEIFS